MKHLLHKLSSLRLLMLLAVLLGMGSSAAWADTSTLTFTTKCNGSGTADDGASWTVTSDGTESNFDNTKGIHYGTSSAQVQYISLSTSDISGTITEVVVNASTASGVTATASVTVGGNAFGGSAQSLTTSAANYTFTGSASGEIVVTVTKPSKAAKAIYVKSVVVTYTTGGGLENNDLALTDDPVDLEFDLYNNSNAQVINYTTSSTGAVTIANNDYASFDIDEENLTITVTPTAVTPETQTITINQAADDSYMAGSATFTLTITDSTPIPTHTATFSVNGETTSDTFEEGAAITFPANPGVLYGKTFVGWVAEAIDGTTDEAPEFVISATMGNSDVTYYAVFADVVQGSETIETLTYDASSQDNGFPTSYAASTDYDLAGVSFNITQIYDNNNYFQWRAQGNSNGTGAMYNNDALNVQTVVITYTDGDNNKNISLKVGDVANPTGGTSITPSSSGNVYTFDCSGNNKEYFVLTNGTGAGYTSSIVITYKTGTPNTYSGYCTTVVAAAVETPTIVLGANPFNFSTTATITCETEGAVIKYSFDGETWNDYTDALTITETTTIYAKAVKDEDESTVASVTVTKNKVEPTVTIDATGITNTNVFDGTEAGSLAAAVTYNDAAVEGAEVTWNGDNDAVATIDATTGAVTLVAAGTVTFTATYAGNSDYSEKTATYEMTVTNQDPNAPGSENNPYTVAEAIDAIDNDGDVTDVYVAGIVSQVDSYNSTYHSITYWISEDGTTTSQQFEVYSGKDIDGADFSSKDDIQVGDIVVIKGNITYYSKSSVYEFSSNNQLVSLVRKPAAPTFSPVAGAVAAGTQITLSTTTEGATIYYTMDGTDPTTESNEYTSAITITDATTIKAIAVKGTASSDVTTAAYTIAVPVATPTFSPAAGTFDSAQEVAISCETVGATIYYSYDNENWTEYTEPLNINETKTVYAKAEKEGSATSAVASAEYTIQIPTITFAEATPKNLNYEAQEYDFAFVGAYTTGSFAVVVCDYEGNATTYDWFSAELNGNAVRVTLTQNVDTENGRTAYFKVTADNAESEIFSVVQGNFVVDYAELPFAFNDGKAAIEETTGLTQDGLGSDYASAPKLKFDSTDDYIVLKINERPGILTFDIKGNSFSGGTFTVQTSEDGETYTDLKAYTELGNTQSEEFGNLGENVRYIKWIYTSKSSGNVALGNIELAKYVTPAPAIVAPASVELKAEDTAGEIAYSINNPDGVSSLNATCEDGWISNIEVTATKVTFTTAVNTGAERVGTITLSYTGATDKVVTVTQAEAVVMLSYSLATTITSGKHYIITNGSNKAMGAQNANNRAAVDITIDGEDATFASNAGVAEFVICGPYANGYYTIYDASENGYLYAASSGSNYLKTKADIDANDNSYWTIGIDGSGVATIQAKGNYTRNVMQYNDGSTLFACYSSASQGDIYLFEKDGEVAPTESITIGAAGYTTYTTQNPISVPSGVKAYIATAVNASTIHLEEILDAPARTPIILQSDNPNTYDLEKDYAGLYNEVVAATPNILKSSNGSVTGNGSIYALGVGKEAPYEGVVGFYVVNDEQTIPAGKAYLDLSGGGSVKEFLTFDFDADAIRGLSPNPSPVSEGSIFNLAGQKMNRLQKGINIVNGKKVLVK